MECAEEVGFVAREMLKRAETMSRKIIRHFKVLFLVKLGPGGQNNRKITDRLTSGYFFVRIKKHKGNFITMMIENGLFRKLNCYHFLLISQMVS
jgi:hypothetical protein